MQKVYMAHIPPLVEGSRPFPWSLPAPFSSSSSSFPPFQSARLALPAATGRRGLLDEDSPSSHVGMELHLQQQQHQRQRQKQQQYQSVWPAADPSYPPGVVSSHDRDVLALLLSGSDEAALWLEQRRRLLLPTMHHAAQPRTTGYFLQQQQQQQIPLPRLSQSARPPSPRPRRSERTFKPMQMVFRQRQQQQAQQAQQAQQKQRQQAHLHPHLGRIGSSPNYRGDAANPHNRGDHVPELANASLFLTNLPASARVGDLLRAVAALGPTGRVFSASVSPPDPARGHWWAAAKISFFSRAGAEALKQRVDGGELCVRVDGSFPSASSPSASSPSTSTSLPPLIRAIWNRDRKGPRTCVQADECRVLRIRGPATMVNYAALTAYFEQKFYYELEGVRMLEVGDVKGDVEEVGGVVPAEAAMEWRFASFQSQAIAAKMALNQEIRAVKVEYGEDPCEKGWA